MTSTTPTNGTLMGSQVGVPASMFLSTGDGNLQFTQITSVTGPLDLPHYVWVPFSSNQTLTLGQTYNLRLVPSGCNVAIVAGNREDQMFGALGRNSATWDFWRVNRRVSWSCFEDSRGPQFSTDGGANWNYWPGSHQQIPITFKCV